MRNLDHVQGIQIRRDRLEATFCRIEKIFGTYCLRLVEDSVNELESVVAFFCMRVRFFQRDHR